MLVKLDFPRDRGENKKYVFSKLWLASSSFPPCIPIPIDKVEALPQLPSAPPAWAKGQHPRESAGKKKTRWRKDEKVNEVNGWMEWNEMQWNGMSAWVNEWMPTCLHAWIYGYMDIWIYGYMDIWIYGYMIYGYMIYMDGWTKERTNENSSMNQWNESGEWNQFNAPQAHVAEVFWIAAVPTMDQHQKCPSPWYLGAKWQRCQVQACKGFRPSVGIQETQACWFCTLVRL